MKTLSIADPQTLKPPAQENIVQTDTLDTLALAKNYNRWILETFQPYIGQRVLEVGSGTGNFSQLLLENCQHLTTVDVVPAYVPQVYDRVTVPAGKSLEARCQDIFDCDEAERRSLGTFDTIVILNVLEHIAQDEHAIAVMQQLLNPGGHLVVLVPAHEFLMSDYDRLIHHYRRYTKASLGKQLGQHQLTVVDNRYFNAVGVFGWWVKFCLLKKTDMEAGPVQLFDSMVPIFRAVEGLISPPIGLSVITVARKA